MKTETATRRDLDELTALNRDYIHSVQHGDVRRFDEILAEDFLCSNPDGSLVDKNQFLAQTARPMTITGLSAHEVRVRVLGDIAIIHARTNTPRQTASSAMAAIPMSGPAGTESGWRYLRM
jgi:ketosteroid isomerase-like protein